MRSLVPVTRPDTQGSTTVWQKRLGANLMLNAAHERRTVFVEGCLGRTFWRDFANSPVNQGYHWWHNAESYWLIGQAMGSGMLKAMKGIANNHDEWYRSVAN